jgi:hypothetical protein
MRMYLKSIWRGVLHITILLFLVTTNLNIYKLHKQVHSLVTANLDARNWDGCILHWSLLQFRSFFYWIYSYMKLGNSKDEMIHCNCLMAVWWLYDGSHEGYIIVIRSSKFPGKWSWLKWLAPARTHSIGLLKWWWEGTRIFNFEISEFCVQHLKFSQRGWIAVVYRKPKYLAEAEDFDYSAFGFGCRSFILNVRPSVFS